MNNSGLNTSTYQEQTLVKCQARENMRRPSLSIFCGLQLHAFASLRHLKKSVMELTSKDYY